MGPESRMDRWLDVLWTPIVGVLSSIAIVLGAGHVGGTFDERFYLDAGLTRWRTGSTFDLMKAGTMPLPVDVETAALRIVERVRDRPWQLESEYDDALRIARFGTLLFWWITLIYAGRIARSLGGPWAGRLAVLSIALEPNLLAHAGLATTDLAITATMLMFTFHYQAGRNAGWGRRVGLPALICATAILAKASGLVFVPICMIATETTRIWSATGGLPPWPRLKTSIRGLTSRAFLLDFAIMGTIALGFVYLYCGSDFQSHPKLVAASRSLPEGAARTAAVWFAENLRIFNNAGVGLWYQIKHNMKGHGAYLLGHVTTGAFWYYFPIALSIKLPEALLVAPLGLLLFARRHLLNAPCVAALLMLVFTVNCRVQIGVRMQLPLVALAICGFSAAMANAMADASAWNRRTGIAIVLAALVWTGISTARSWPRTLGYVNSFWGEPAERWLSDSNLDWGQGLKDLDRWRDERGIGEIDLWYFGTDPAATRSPFHYLPLHSLKTADEPAFEQHVKNQYLAVGTTILYGSYVVEPTWLLEKLRRTRPVGRTQTFLIYDRADLVRAAKKQVDQQPQGADHQHQK